MVQTSDTVLASAQRGPTGRSVAVRAGAVALPAERGEQRVLRGRTGAHSDIHVSSSSVCLSHSLAGRVESNCVVYSTLRVSLSDVRRPRARRKESCTCACIFYPIYLSTKLPEAATAKPLRVPRLALKRRPHMPQRKAAIFHDRYKTACQNHLQSEPVLRALASYLQS